MKKPNRRELAEGLAIIGLCLMFMAGLVAVGQWAEGNYRKAWYEETLCHPDAEAEWERR